MKNNKTEDVIAGINSNVFFKEFTFTDNKFKDIDSKDQFELGDNVVWLDDLLLIFEIKDRNVNEKSVDISGWYKNKILKLAVKQIKKDQGYLNNSQEISIKNARGHVLDIKKALSCSCKKYIIIYTPDGEFTEERRNKRFHKSTKIGLIHLFHSEDYCLICKYLITPAEINEYLDFRERFYSVDPSRSDSLSEQYVLGHFLETLDVKEVCEHYIENLQKIDTSSKEFNLSSLIENFQDRIINNKGTTDYYSIVKEIAKLKRDELKDLKSMISYTRKECDSDDYCQPRRMYTKRTDCAFVLIPLPSLKSKNWEDVLSYFTCSHKYDVKAKKCIGLVMFRNPTDKYYFELRWGYSEYPWMFDSEEEDNLANLKMNELFAEVRVKEPENRYKNSLKYK